MAPFHLFYDPLVLFHNIFFFVRRGEGELDRKGGSETGKVRTKLDRSGARRRGLTGNGKGGGGERTGGNHNCSIPFDLESDFDMYKTQKTEQ